jgi:hypothetical protein
MKYVIAFTAAFLALAIGAYARFDSGSTAAATKWRYMQLETTRQILLRPTLDSDGNFDKAEHDKTTKGIDWANKMFGDEFRLRMTEAGNQGWELVGVTSASSESGVVLTVHTTAYLKRSSK